MCGQLNIEGINDLERRLKIISAVLNSATASKTGPQTPGVFADDNGVAVAARVMDVAELSVV